MAKPDIHRLVELHKLLLTFQEIQRHVCYATPLTDNRAENDAEHSYSLAMTAWFLSEYFPELNTDKVIRIALAHDLIEVHSGDTSVFADASKLATKSSRETAALEKLSQEWTDFPELADAMQEYKTRASKEAKFVYALDKIMPIMLIFIGEGYTWQKEGITPERLDEVKRHKVAVSPEIAPYYDELYELLLQHRHYFTRKKASQQG